MAATYTPRVPTPELVDRAIEHLRVTHPLALERGDFLAGMLAAFAAVGASVSNFGHVSVLARTNPLVAGTVMAFSQNLGDNFELYRAVRDTLYPADDVESVLPS